MTDASPLPDDQQFPYVLTDIGWAARHGYGSDLERQAERLRQGDPNTVYLLSLTPQRRPPQ